MDYQRHSCVSGEKMSVCVTIFLTLVVSLSILLNVLPHCSLHVSVHVTYLSVLSVCSALSVVLSFWVLGIRNRGCGHGSRGHIPEGVGAGWTRFVKAVRRYRFVAQAPNTVSLFSLLSIMVKLGGYVMLCYVMLRHVMLCYVILCYVMLG
jgi:hypothetical protein